MWINRRELKKQVLSALRNNAVTALMGPRRCGKTTLARELARQKKWKIFDMENPADEFRLQNPLSALQDLRQVVVIDEVQRRPDVMPVLRVLVDRRPLPVKFLILGSASPDLAKHSSETLAGRIAFVDMGGFSLKEVGSSSWSRLWLRGGFPSAYLAKSEAHSSLWRQNFMRTFLERDLPQIGVQVPARTLQRFWTMLAHHHGQKWNASEIAASLGVAHTTTRHYLDILTGSFLVRELPPWFENVGKRVVKAPKIYIRDSGLLHTLLRLETRDSLEEHPKYGFSWEGFAMEQLLLQAGDRDAYFWGTHAGAELDLLLIRRGKRWGFEFKLGRPSVTKSMRVALNDLKLRHLWVVYPGHESFRIDEKISVLSLSDAVDLKFFKAWF